MQNNLRTTAGKIKHKLAEQTRATQEIRVKLDDHTKKIDEALFYIHRLKNGLTVRTGEFEAITTLFTGQKIYVDTRDISVAPHLMLEGTWEPEITEVYRKFIKPGNVVIDAGANFGYFGLVAGTSIGKDGKIFFIEANSQLLPYINKTIPVNGLDGRAVASNIGLGAKEGTLELKMLGDFWGSSTFAGTSDSTYLAPVRGTQKVRMTSLDSYCKEHGIKQVDILKVDIEGFEDVAYLGMKKTIKNSPNMKLFLEFTPAAYKNPGQFFKQIAEDFSHIYAITADLETPLVKVTSYKQLDGLTEAGWTMILASKEHLSLK